MRLMLLRLHVIIILKQLVMITDPRSSLTKTKSSRGVQFPGQDAANKNGRDG